MYSGLRQLSGLLSCPVASQIRLYFLKHLPCLRSAGFVTLLQPFLPDRLHDLEALFTWIVEASDEFNADRGLKTVKDLED